MIFNKKVVSVVLSICLLFSIFSNSVLANQNEHKLESTITKEIKDLDGKKVGTKVTNITIERIVNKNGTKAIVTEVTNHKLNSKSLFNSKLYKDSVKTTTFEITKDGNYYVNGEKLSEEYLAQTIDLSKINNKMTLDESGGKSNITYYTNNGSGSYFRFMSYPDADFHLDNPIGTKLEKWAYDGTNLASDFKMYATEVANARADILVAGAEIIAAGFTGVLTAATVVGLIVAGTICAIAAYQLYSASNSGRAAVDNAYKVLVRM